MTENLTVKAIRIVLKSSDTKCLELAVAQLISLAMQQRVSYQGPIPLPMRKRRYTVNRSPHIDKTSREQFESKVYKRLLVVVPTVEFTNAIAQIMLPSSVWVKIGYPNPVLSSCDNKKKASTVKSDKKKVLEQVNG